MAEETLPQPDFNEAAPARDGDDFLMSFANAIREPEDPILRGQGSSGDLKLYDQVRADAQVWSTLQQRRDAVVSIDLEVLPGDDRPASAEAAEKLKEELEALDIDTRTRRMLWGVFYGYGVAECMWKIEDGRVRFDRIKVRRARRFGFDVDGNLMLRRTAARNEVRMPDQKFWVMTTGADTDDEPYGLGLAHLLFWPAYFKRHGLKAWMMALNKYATPTAKGTFPKGSPEEDVAKLLAALKAIQSDSALVMPEGMTAELMQSSKSAGMDYHKFHSWLESNVAKIVLSQTMTTDDGASRSQGEVHMDVRDEVAESDALLMCGSFNEGPADWWRVWNYGDRAATPILRRKKIEAEDADAAAERDKTLSEMGWHPTRERIETVHGDGYEYREPKSPTIGHSGGDPLDDDAPPGLASVGGDALDRFADMLIDGGAAPAAAADILAPIAALMDEATTLEQFRAGLDAVDGSRESLGDHLAEAMFAARIGGEVGAALRDDVAVEER